MIERLIKAVIVIVAVAILIAVLTWALASVGVVLPQVVITGVYVIAALLVLLYLWRAFGADLRL